MRQKLLSPSLDNLKLGIPMTLCLFNACLALLDAVQFATGTLIPPSVGAVLNAVLRITVLLSFFGPLLVWWLFGDRLMERMHNFGWLTGAFCGIPVAVAFSFLTGFLQDLNRTQAWMDEDLLFRICRMLCASVLPLCALIGYVIFAVKKRRTRTP